MKEKVCFFRISPWEIFLVYFPSPFQADELPVVLGLWQNLANRVKNVLFLLFRFEAMAAQLISEECYSDEDEDYFANDDSISPTVDDEPGLAAGWQLAARGVALALNNRVEEAQNLLRVDSSCIHRQAGFCYLTFIVSILISIQFCFHQVCKANREVV